MCAHTCTSAARHSTYLLPNKMNSFKNILVLCVVMAASCSGSYMGSWSSQMGNPALSSQTGSGGYNKVQQVPVTDSPNWLQQDPGFEDPIEPSAPIISQPAFPTTSRKICNCVTIPAAAQHFTGSPAAISPVAKPAQYTAQHNRWTSAVAPAPAAAPATQFYGTPAPHYRMYANRG